MTMNRQAFLDRAGIQVDVLEFWLEQQWVIPAQTREGMDFSERDVARANFIQDLKNDFGVNDEGIDVVLHLVDQLHGLRNVLAHLRAMGLDSSL